MINWMIIPECPDATIEDCQPKVYIYQKEPEYDK